MFGGYYSNPIPSNDYGYVPEGAMTAMVSGNTVATNSFSGLKPQWKKEPQAPSSIPIQPQLPSEDDENETFIESVTEKQTARPPIILEEEKPVVLKEKPVFLQEKPGDEAIQEQIGQEQEQENEEQDLVVSTETAVVTSTRKPKTPKRLSTSAAIPKKRQPQKPQPEEEEEDVQEDDDAEIPSSWPFGSRRGGPSYTAFFPISFGAPGGSAYPSAIRRRNSGGESQDDAGVDEGYYPGSATAIANSFSTGKGGVATSHATSFGDPYLAARFLRNLGRKGGWKDDEKED